MGIIAAIKFLIAKATRAIWRVVPRLVVALLLLLVVGGVLWKVPEWQAGRVTGPTPVQRANLEDEFRKTLATIIAGLFVLLTGYLAWRNVSIAQATLATNVEGQLTDRFTKAIEQLGATQDGKPILETRLGAIYALERIARDSLRDHGPIMEVLSAYVRHNAPAKGIERFNVNKLDYKPRADIQAVLTVIGRRDDRQREAEKEAGRLIVDLSATNLRGVCLVGAHLGSVIFNGARLERASFMNKTHLERASFYEAHLEHASFYEAHLEHVLFMSAHLEHTTLQSAHLEDALLQSAHLDDAFLEGAHLEGAILLAATGLTQAQIDKTFMDERTELNPPLQRSTRVPSTHPAAPGKNA